MAVKSKIPESHVIIIGKTGSKRQRHDAACPNEECECYGKVNGENILGNGAYKGVLSTLNGVNYFKISLGFFLLNNQISKAKEVYNEQIASITHFVETMREKMDALDCALRLH